MARGRLAFVLAAVVGGCGGGSANPPDGGPAPVDPCGGVPIGGRCTSSTAYEYCEAPNGRAVPRVQAVACGAGEACRETNGRASCELVAECRANSSECAGTSQLRVCDQGRWVTQDCPSGCASHALGAACSPAVETQALSGHVTYAFRAPAPDFSGWGEPQYTAGGGFVVVSVRSAGEAFELIDVARSGVGAEDLGRFSVRVPATPTDADHLVVVAAAPSADGRGVGYVVANPNLPAGQHAPGTVPPMPNAWAWSFPLASVASDGELRIEEAHGSGAARLFDYLRYSLALSAARLSRPGLSLVVWLGYGVTWECGACEHNSPITAFGQRFDAQIWMPGGDDQGYWSDPVTAHELGHWVMDSYGRGPNEGGPHSIGVPTLPGQAWSEGFATWFSVDLRQSPVYYDRQQGSMFWLDLSQRAYSSNTPWQRATPGAGLLQRMDENEVASILMTLGAPDAAPLYTALASPRMTTAPFLRGYTRHTWQVQGTEFVNVVDTRDPAPMLADFLDALNCAGFPRAQIDTATEPSTAYPYPSDSPLCR